MGCWYFILWLERSGHFWYRQTLHYSKLTESFLFNLKREGNELSTNGLSWIISVSWTLKASLVTFCVEERKKKKKKRKTYYLFFLFLLRFGSSLGSLSDCSPAGKPPTFCTVCYWRNGHCWCPAKRAERFKPSRFSFCFWYLGKLASWQEELSYKADMKRNMLI